MLEPVPLSFIQPCTELYARSWGSPQRYTHGNPVPPSFIQASAATFSEYPSLLPLPSPSCGGAKGGAGGGMGAALGPAIWLPWS